MHWLGQERTRPSLSHLWLPKVLLFSLFHPPCRLSGPAEFFIQILPLLHRPHVEVGELVANVGEKAVLETGIVLFEVKNRKWVESII